METLHAYVALYQNQRDSLVGDIKETIGVLHDELRLGTLAAQPGFRVTPVHDWWTNRKHRQLCIALQRPNQVRSPWAMPPLLLLY